MVKQLNSALHEEPRNQRTYVIPLKQENSFLEWLRDSGRLIPRGEEEYYAYDEEEEEEIAEIVGHDTYSFEEETIEELED
ncbi:DUF3134 family protein [Fischerella sp. JS2]|uniref:DUF3134 family protein n=1 Tax=Fischerella sp. JS2 TaxID=2597771 RepID=UPI0028EDEC06|nr:DUF3134 family protein [Fischerella sp. JS2]